MSNANSSSPVAVVDLIESHLFQTYAIFAERDVARSLSRLHSGVWKARLTGAPSDALRADYLEVANFLGVDEGIIDEADRFLVWTIPIEIASRLQSAVAWRTRLSAIESMFERLLAAGKPQAARHAA